MAQIDILSITPQRASTLPGEAPSTEIELDFNGVLRDILLLQLGGTADTKEASPNAPEAAANVTEDEESDAASQQLIDAQVAPPVLSKSVEVPAAAPVAAPAGTVERSSGKPSAAVSVEAAPQPTTLDNTENATPLAADAIAGEKPHRRMNHVAELPELKAFAATSTESGVVVPSQHAPVARAQAPSQLALATPMSNPRWSDGLGDTVRWMVHSGQQHAELSINPPELGPVEISVTLEADRASVVFVAPHATTREALEASLPRLHGLLAEAGIALDNAQVGADAQAGGQERQRPQHARAQAAAEDNTPRVWREASGAVDIYA